jgi:hypothetical protein
MTKEKNNSREVMKVFSHIIMEGSHYDVGRYRGVISIFDRSINSFIAFGYIKIYCLCGKYCTIDQI